MAHDSVHKPFWTKPDNLYENRVGGRGDAPSQKVHPGEFLMLLAEGFEVGIAALHPQPYGQDPAVLVNVYVAGSGVRLGGIRGVILARSLTVSD